MFVEEDEAIDNRLVVDAKDDIIMRKVALDVPTGQLRGRYVGWFFWTGVTPAYRGNGEWVFESRGRSTVLFGLCVVTVVVVVGSGQGGGRSVCR